MYSRHIIKSVQGHEYVYAQLSYRRRQRIRTVRKFVGRLDEVEFKRGRRWI